MRSVGFLVFCLSAAGISTVLAQAATVSCAPASSPVVIRAEGITERIGDIVLHCSTVSPDAAVNGNLTVFLSANVTNRLTDGQVSGVTLTGETVGAQPVTLPVAARLTGPGTLTFHGVNFPVDPSGITSLRISGILVNASAEQPRATPSPIRAFVGFNGSNTLLSSNAELPVGVPQPGLFATVKPEVVQRARALPNPLTVSALLAEGTRAASIRFTEGFSSSYKARAKAIAAGEDTGTRLIVRFQGFPAGSKLLVPNAIAGSSASEPTSTGDLGLPPSAGVYTPAVPGGTLLLSRVEGADSSGTGGAPVFAPAGTGPVNLEGVGEVLLADGTGYVVYEVLDENQTLAESAQLPVFLGTADLNRSVAVAAEVSFAPVSTVFQAAPEPAPIPRFSAVVPELDCTLLGDCTAQYFPRLSVDPAALSYQAASGSAPVSDFLRVINAGSGTLQWTYSLTYLSGEGWLVLDRGPAGFRASVLPQDLEPGIYEAVLTIDAGPLAGSKVIPIRFEVTDPVPQPVPPPVIAAITNAADFTQGALQPGSTATIFGVRFSGLLSVTFDGVPADILFANSEQLNVVVPPGLTGKAFADVIVSADSRPSNAVRVAIAPAAPAIFGILNADSQLNASATPALTGSVVQIFLTGAEAYGGTVDVKIHDREMLVPSYAGPAPGLAGVQQVNVAVPIDLPTMRSEVVVCVTPPGGERVCSRPKEIYLEHP